MAESKSQPSIEPITTEREIREFVENHDVPRSRIIPSGGLVHLPDSGKSNPSPVCGLSNHSGYEAIEDYLEHASLEPASRFACPGCVAAILQVHSRDETPVGDECILCKQADLGAGAGELSGSPIAHWTHRQADPVNCPVLAEAIAEAIENDEDEDEA